MKSQNGCPFCQGDVIDIINSSPPAGKGLQVQCDDCGACGPIYDNKDEAIKGWELGISGIGGKRLRIK
jgi:hypothetical protein